ncbi:conjugal transfer protein TraD [Pectobacterium atrosepticum]|uniref:conjugal transfer protein TraD n=1 Tax=Pectobacterium atrosepticum TaxID=29471 RepID=UPI000907943F|nr:conjugal transfer protein TraD [Pectobacterium atrosepticum]
MDSQQPDIQEDNINTNHLTLNVINIIPNMGGVPLVWAVLLLGSAMLLSIIGFVVSNSLIGLLFGIPSIIVFYIIKFICINNLDALSVFQLKFRGKFRRLLYGREIYKLSPSLDKSGVNNGLDQIKRIKNQK